MSATTAEQIEIVYFALDRDDDERRKLFRLLSDDETERAARFRFDKHRNRFIAGRASIRQILASRACCQRGAHRHHLSPGFNPAKPKAGAGVERSLPTLLLKARKSAVITAQTVCEPTSSGPVLQQPSR